jgi:hypothetical protein
MGLTISVSLSPALKLLNVQPLCVSQDARTAGFDAPMLHRRPGYQTRMNALLRSAMEDVGRKHS